MAEPPNGTLEYAELLLKEGKEREARLLLVAYIKRRPDSAQAWWVLSQAVEDVRQEEDCLKRLLQLEPGHAEALRRLAEIQSPPPAAPPSGASPLPTRPVSPFVLTAEELEEVEIGGAGGFDLFSPGPSWPSEAPPQPPAEPDREVPAWAEPPQYSPPSETSAIPPGGAPALPLKKKHAWVVDVAVISLVLCLLLGVVGFFLIRDYTRTMAAQAAATQTAAAILASLPRQTLEPTWTSTPTFTPPATRTRTFTPTLAVPTSTPPLLQSLTPSPIPAALIAPRVNFFPPDFTLPDLSGASFNLHTHLGKPTLLIFWATWCPYCEQEMDDLTRLYAAYHEQGWQVLAVNVGETYSEVSTYQGEHNLPFPLLPDPDRVVSRHYGFSTVPHHVFIGLNGRIMAVDSGSLTYSQLENKVRASMRTYPTPTP